MTAEHAHWWTRAAQSLPRSGLLWLALTAVAMTSLANSGAAMTAGARLVAALSAGTTGKLKPNAPGAPALLPGEADRTISHQAQRPEGGAKRIAAGGMPAGLMTSSIGSAAKAPDHDAYPAAGAEPGIPPHAFQARAPPRLA